MNLKSEWTGNILRIFLAVLIGLALLDLIGTFIYAADLNFYVDHVQYMNNFVNLISVVLYLMILIVFLIWIYRVHMDLNNRLLQYPITPGKSLVHILVPFYNFYGIPALFTNMGYRFKQAMPGSRRRYRWVSGLAGPLIICVILSRINSQYLNRVEADPSTGFYIYSGIVEVVSYTIYLTLCVLIIKGLRQLQHVEIPDTNTVHVIDADSSLGPIGGSTFAEDRLQKPQ